MKMELPVVFGKEGHRLFGVLHTSDGGEKGPGVVLFHGFTGNKIEPHRLFVNIARKLTTMGINVLRFDFYGSGDSEGDFKEMTFSGEVEDAFLAIDFIKQQKQVDSTRIGIIGLSMGGAIAACVAGRRANEVKTTILLSAVSDFTVLSERLREGFPKELEEKARAEGFLDYYGWPLSIRFIEELPNIHPADEIKNFKNPVLIVHGTKDEAVPVEAAHMFYNVLKDRLVETKLKIIEGSDHTYNSLIWEKEVLDTIIDWLSRNL